MRIVAVDLAAKFSAALTITSAGVVCGEIDSWQRAEGDWIRAIVAPWVEYDPFDTGSHLPDALVVEDLPHGVQFMTNTKNVCRLQGRIVQEMYDLSVLDCVRFIAPVAWRKHFALKPGKGPEQVERAARARGYQAPDLTARAEAAGTGAKAIARKVTTDYYAAWCIGRWFLDSVEQAGGSLDFPGVTRYGDIGPRRRRPTKINKEQGDAQA